MDRNLLWGIIFILLGISSIIHSRFIDPNKPARQSRFGGRTWSGEELRWRNLWGGAWLTAVGVVLLIVYFGFGLGKS
jgi:ABC-type Fe3+ transport system permease subunit